MSHFSLDLILALLSCAGIYGLALRKLIIDWKRDMEFEDYDYEETILAPTMVKVFPEEDSDVA